ncbi:MAG TPA: HAD family acid phosphatase [Acidobacteriaceae bacterium]|nr:HAD family acid phosphatase [Acidobacteriaceae bacterium]
MLFVCLAVAGFSAGAQTVLIPQEPPNLGRLETKLRAYHDCTGDHGCYTTDLNRETAEATDALERLVRANRASAHPARLAVVLDIDETSLSNWAEIDQADFAYNAAVWNRWVEEAQAPAIPGTLRFYREAERLHVAVFFITGRPESQRAATEKNLRDQGYKQWNGLVLRSAAELKLTADVYKAAARGRIVASGYRIAVNVGDQRSDLAGAPRAEVSVKLSDPFYFIP